MGSADSAIHAPGVIWEQRPLVSSPQVEGAAPPAFSGWNTPFHRRISLASGRAADGATRRAYPSDEAIGQVPTTHDPDDNDVAKDGGLE